MSDCGCYPSRDGIVYCPKHSAAPWMYEALKSRRYYEHFRHLNSPLLKMTQRKGFWPRYERLVRAKERCALALADGSDEKDGG